MYETPILPTPGDLSDGVVSLELREIAAAVPEKGWAPAYHFTIVRAASQEPVGLISCCRMIERSDERALGGRRR